jgi:hypothetical protein
LLGANRTNTVTTGGFARTSSWKKGPSRDGFSG